MEILTFLASRTFIADGLDCGQYNWQAGAYFMNVSQFYILEAI